MANYAISASSISENKNVFIRGKLAFARLTRLIDGADLAASDQRKVNNGMSPVGKPHTTATITEAEVVFADPSNPTREEQFVAERRYTSSKNPDSGANYSIDSKGTNLPAIVILSPSGDGTYDQDLTGNDLAQGSDVTLVLRTYKPKSFSNRGLALEQVIVHDNPPRYYNAGGVDSNELAARGIVLNTPIQAVQSKPAGSAVGEAEDAVGTDVEDGLSFPSPQPAAPTAAPVQATAPAQVQARPEAEAEAEAPVATPAAAAPAAAPVAVEETLEAKLERIQAENDALKNAGSAVGAPAAQGPWNGGEQPGGITYQG